MFSKKPREMQTRIMECIDRLGVDPRHPGLNAHKMQGTNGQVWEAYVDGANRVTYHWDGPDTIVLRNNCNHDMLTRRP